MQALTYRPEITGLRAIAVLSVILYHCGLSALSGGFVGVDVFFVISGFLITTHITDSLGKNSFSLVRFYSRRALRLLPAAAVVIASTLVAGYFFLYPAQYSQLASSAISSLVLSANIFFFKSSGYFDASAEISPLLHMWSLSVEEQFYLLFPALLIAASAIFGRRGIIYALVSLAAASFCLSIYSSIHHPTFAFYMLPVRAWEFAIGGLLTFLPTRAKDKLADRGIVAILGLMLISASIVFIQSSHVFPGYIAAVPVLGAALVIAGASGTRTMAHRLLSAKPLEFIGKTSYSAYLWHWPIVVYYRIYSGSTAFTIIEIAALAAASIALGWVSWKFVEETTRYVQAPPRRILIGSAISIALLTLYAGYVAQDGLPSRVDERAIQLTDIDIMWRWDCPRTMVLPHRVTVCVLGAPWEKATSRGLLWGDSHSEHFAPMLHESARKNGISIALTPKSCPPYLDSSIIGMHYPKRAGYNENCTRKRKATIAWVNSEPKIDFAVLAAAWSGYAGFLSAPGEPEPVNRERSSSLMTAALEDLILQLSPANIHILLLGDMPRPNRDMNDCVAGTMGNSLLRSSCYEPTHYLDARSIKTWHKPSDTALRQISMQHKNVSLILPTEKICDKARCTTYVNHEFIYRDSNHLRRNLSRPAQIKLADKLGIDEFFGQIPLDR